MKIAFLGTGAMGGALARGVVAAGFCRSEDVLTFDTDAEKLEAVSREMGAQPCQSAAEAAAGAEIVVLCVKPAVVASVLDDISPRMDAGKLLISIAAGVTIETIESHLLTTVAVIRVMPNTPAMAGEGAAALALGSSATGEHRDLAVRMLESVGVAVVVEEKLMDAVTGLSGSGPAFIYTVIEAMADAGVSMGLTRDIALKLAAQTCLGAATLVRDTGKHPAVLRDQVTSPGGTTIAGCAELERSGLRAALINAVQAAARRSKELSGK